MARRPTKDPYAPKDTMGELMDPDSNKTIKEESNLSENQEKRVAASAEMNKAINQSSNKTGAQGNMKAGVQAYFPEMAPEELPPLPIPKEKATFNLSKGILQELEDAWISIRKMRGDKKISKTDFVEQAIESALSEYKTKGEYSKFYGKLAGNKEGNVH